MGLWVSRCGRKAVLPNGNERLPIGSIRGFEGAKVGLAFRFSNRCQDDSGQVKSEKQFQKEQTDAASVEVLKRVDGQEPAFGKGE